MSEEEIAAECGVSRRYVNKVLARGYAKMISAFAASGVDRSSLTELDELFHRDPSDIGSRDGVDRVIAERMSGVVVEFEQLVDRAQAA